MRLRFPKFRASRKYEDDIFGFIIRRTDKPNRVINFLMNLRRERRRVARFNYNVFRIDLRTPKKLDKPHSLFLWRLIYRNRASYYFNLKQDRLKYLMMYPEMRRGDFGRNFGDYFEGRVDAVLIKSNFLETMVEARNYIESGKVLVNDKIIPIHRHFSIRLNDVLCFVSRDVTENVKKTMLERFKDNRICIAPPASAEISWRLLRLKFWISPSAGAAVYHFDLPLRKIYNEYKLT